MSTDGSWTAPDGLGISSMRPVRLSRGGYVIAAVIALLVVGGFVGGVLLWNLSMKQQATRERLQRDGSTVAGRIVRLWLEDSKERTPEVKYRFEAEGHEIAGQSEAPRTVWEHMKNGDALQVRYVKGHPEINHPSDWEYRVMPAWVPFLLPAIFLFGAVVLSLQVRCQWGLLAEGLAVRGVLLEVKRQAKGGPILKYEFRTQGGEVVRGKSTGKSRSVRLKDGEICVLYDRENPKRNAIYPMDFVRLEQR